MKNLLSLTKVGNLKIGFVRDGRPVATERILVTRPTKENEENFKILDGFSQEGETAVKVTLPFDNPELNFEVAYVGFMKVNDVEYIAKAKGLGEKILLYPLNPEDFDKKIIDLDELTEETISKYNMKLTGFLKVHLVGYSGFGEVFYFKTRSINSIRAIRDQLKILDILTNGKSSGIPLIMKPVKKDVGENQIVFVSLAFHDEIFGNDCHQKTLDKDILKRENSFVGTRMQDLEKAYIESREPKPEDIIHIKDIENAKIEVERDVEQEIHEIKKEAEKEKGPVYEKVEAIFKELGVDKIPLPIGVILYKNMNDEKAFKKYFSEERTLPEVNKEIKKMNRKDKK